MEAIYEQLADFMPLDVDVIRSSREQTCIFVIAQKKSSEKVYEKLKSFGFSYPPIACDYAPSEQIEQWEKEIAQLEREIEDSIQAILSKKKEEKRFGFLQIIR